MHLIAKLFAVTISILGIAIARNVDFDYDNLLENQYLKENYVEDKDGNINQKYYGDFAAEEEGEFEEEISEDERLENYAKDNIKEDAKLTTTGLIVKYGYAAELHTVETSDGYILEVHRMFKSNSGSEVKPVIFLMHGLLCSSGDWVNMGPSHGLGYYYADLGYDVWLGNARGNRYSRKHKKYNPSSLLSSKFWDFSWHEIGSIDVPAMIDFALLKTGQKQLHYVGHSQGTTSFFVMCSTRPEYNDKIISMHALAPIVFMKNMKSPLVKALSYFNGMMGGLTAILGSKEFLPKTAILSMAGRLLCQDTSLTQAVCTNIMFMLGGYNKEQLNATMMPVMLGHTPAGASTKQILHYVQLKSSGKFSQFDYGSLKNKRVYNSRDPPDYDLTKVTVPVHLYWGDNDLMAAPEDVQQLAGILPNVVVNHHVDNIKFTHLDFIWAKDVISYVYNHVKQNIEKITA